MRILILTPSAFPSVTGNAVTTERWRRSLTKKGIIAEVLSVGKLSPAAFGERLQDIRPDIVHVYHAFKAGAFLLEHRKTWSDFSLRLVVTPGGTDINLDFGIPERRETILTVFNMARVIVAQSSETVRMLCRQMPDLAGRIVNVPKAVEWFGNEAYDLRNIAGCSPGDVLFFLPAGIRPVKGNLECLLAMERVHKIRTQIRFVAAGPAVDDEYAGRFKREVHRLAGFARWINTIPLAAMRSAYEASDIVLNASFSEGLSNSVLEAIAAGRPVLASDIPANRRPILGADDDQPAGCLYEPGNAEDFVRQAIKLIDDENFRKTLSSAVRMRRATWPNTEEEADGLIGAYKTALGNSPVSS
jgi:glycosyltransferase involved in cell wall biosynthesis